MEGRLARVSSAAADLNRAYKALTAVAEERRAAIAAVETRATGLAMRVEDLQREREALTRAACRRGALPCSALARSWISPRRAGGHGEASCRSPIAKVEELGGDAGKLRRALDDERRAKPAIGRQSPESPRNRSPMPPSAKAALRAELESQAATLRSADQNNAQQISALRAESSALQGALQAAHKELATLRAELAATRNGAASDRRNGWSHAR